MVNEKLLEEKLREAACFGDLETVQRLIHEGVNVNSRNEVNGWTALHWAAHRNYKNVVSLLLKCGADKGSLTNEGESPYLLSSNREIQILLEGVPHTAEQKKLPITPSYLTNPPLFVSHSTIPNTKDLNHTPVFGVVEELVLKVRIADSGELDFIEIELPKSELTFSKLLEICSKELNIPGDSIAKIRKLPNTVLRKDKDVQRLVNFQELEVVLLKSGNTSGAHLASASSSIQSTLLTNRNQYESISQKKDQTVLY
ncbi:hypothetical protein RUM43_004449 [Polyplax serrata]|uniref:Ankyrin repeat domain-containing protein 40 n=1 Tax=Polyplax serrata TaxID=468196 RepID=A0AAN8SAZ5_POLSC